jgi:NADH-quinone oxidoreductase subunit E
MLSAAARAEVAALGESYAEPTSALMPAFWVAQRELGYVPAEAAREIAEILGVQAGYAAGVLSFYTMYNREPVGKYVLQVCRTLSCSLMGAEGLLHHLEGRLGIGVGDTTLDGRFTLLTAECLASCGTAPAMLINEELYEELTPGRLDEILAGLPA